MKFNLTPSTVEVAMISKVYAFKPFVLFNLEKKTCKNKMLKVFFCYCWQLHWWRGWPFKAMEVHWWLSKMCNEGKTDLTVKVLKQSYNHKHLQVQIPLCPFYNYKFIVSALPDWHVDKFYKFYILNYCIYTHLWRSIFGNSNIICCNSFNTAILVI